MEVKKLTSTKRDTVNYTLYQGNKIVYHGITNDLDRRVAEHKDSGKDFSRCDCSVKRTRESALQHETEDLERYQRNHDGKLPKYNRIL